MSDLKQFTEIMKSMKAYIDCVTDEAYHKGFEAGQHEATTLEYQQGLNDAWEAARKICLGKEDGGISNGELLEIFKVGSDYSALKKYSASEAIAKLKAYEEQQKADDEIKVGDEVRNTLGLMDNAVGFVIGITIEGDYNVSRYIDGKIKTGTWRKENCVKTGKHSDAVVQLLAEIKGEQRNCSTCKYEYGNGVPQCRFCFSSKGYNMWEPKEGTE